MPQPGGKRKLVFWLGAPLLAFCAVIVPLGMGPGVEGRMPFVAVWSASCVLGIFALYDARRFWWAARGVTGIVFLAYAGYLVHEFFFSGQSFELSGSRAEPTPRNALLGFVIVGLPCLWYTIFGRFTLRKPPEKVP